MFTSTVSAVFLAIISISYGTCSVVPVAVPSLRYTLVAPQNIRPFAAQVSTFTQGLNIFAAPYAAGVIGGPAIVTRAVAGPVAHPVPIHPAGPVHPAGIIPSPHVGVPVLPHPDFARSVHAVSPAIAHHHF